MNSMQSRTSKPGLVPLMQVFVCAGAAFVACAYLYAWGSGLSAEDARRLTSASYALSTVFGAIAALVWRAFYPHFQVVSDRINDSAGPLFKRLSSSWIFDTLVLIFLSFSIATVKHWFVITVCVLAWIVTAIRLAFTVKRTTKKA